jgi:hypothetical protein
LVAVLFGKHPGKNFFSAFSVLFAKEILAKNSLVHELQTCNFTHQTVHVTDDQSISERGNIMLNKQSYLSDETNDDFLCRESTRSLFGQPDVLVIHEYLHVYRSNAAHTPEIRLIAAVLQDAIDCYLKYSSAQTRRGKRIFAEAAQWIFGRDDDWLFSFDNICEMLKLDPDYVRQMLRQDAQERLRLVKPSDRQVPQDFPALALRLAS